MPPNSPPPHTSLDLPPLADQVGRLLAAGIAERAGLTARDLRRAAAGLPEGSLLVLTAGLVPVREWARRLRNEGKAGFVVVDFVDADAFGPIGDGVEPPAPLYGVTGLQRGDELANRSPAEAAPAIAAAGRTPLTLSEGVQWAFHRPAVLERNHCFMTIGSRLRRPGGRLDARVPALWISNGTGRDGREHRNAPKVGWCWHNNRHSWLGFASAANRLVPSA